MTSFDEKFDFVVVGSGGGSMCAALVLRAAGKSVLILEKTGLLGGTTARSGGVMWIPNNRFMKRDGVPDSIEQATRYLDSVVGDHNDTPGATRVRRRTYVEQGSQMIDFLVDRGIRLTRVPYWPDYYDEAPGGSELGRTVVAELFDVNELGEWKARLRPNFLDMMVSLDDALKLRFLKTSWEAKRKAVKLVFRTMFAKLRGKHLVTAGAALQGRMLQAAVKAGVIFRTDAAVNELIVEGGRVTGVKAVIEGQARQIKADAVLINAGGFARNQEMRDQYIPHTRTNWSLTAEGDTGEMIREMARCGAALGQMEEMVGNQIAIPPGQEDAAIKPVVQGLTAAPHAILVDQTGQRYMNEAGSYMTYCRGMLQRHREAPAIPSWAIFDSQFMRRNMLIGTTAGSKKPADWYESGFLRKADTLIELAEDLGIPSASLGATVKRFNEFAEKGHDDDFNRGDRAYDRWLGDHFDKHNQSLGAIDQPPYYAMAVYPGDVGTYGGVVCDENSRVLRDDGTPIEGLYATGVSTASVMGRSYPGAGASVGPSFVWGYVAAKHAVAAVSVGDE